MNPTTSDSSGSAVETAPGGNPRSLRNFNYTLDDEERFHLKERRRRSDFDSTTARVSEQTCLASQSKTAKSEETTTL